MRVCEAREKDKEMQMFASSLYHSVVDLLKIPYKTSGEKYS